MLLSAILLAALAPLSPVAQMSGGKATLAACNPGRSAQLGSWHAGFSRDQSGIGGVYAQIENYEPYVSPSSSDNFSVAWVMLTTPAAGNWVQVGWVQHRYGARNTFYQQVAGGVKKGESWFTIPPYQPGSYIYYTALKDYSPGKFILFADGSLLIELTAYFTPSRGRVAGEINNRASQMPGGSGNTMGFFDAKMWTSGAWTAFGGTMYEGGAGVDWGTDPNSGLAYYGGTQAYIWDPACPS